MSRPDALGPPKRLALLAATAGLLAACAGGGDDPSTTAPANATVSDRHSPPSSPTPTRPSADREPFSPPTAIDGSAASRPQPAPTVAVSGGDLPAEIVDAYTTAGGELIEPAEWAARYGTAGLPELTGPGVRLVEATRRAERSTHGWNRTDEAAWLAMATVDRDDLLAQLATAAGASGSPQRRSSVDNGADCVTDTYGPDTAGVTWRVNACGYPRYPQLVAVGVSRTGPSSEPPGLVDPTITLLAELLDANPASVEVRLGPPGADRATLHLSAHLEFPAARTVTALVDAAAGGPLAGWQVLRGDASALLSGPTGATWTLAEGVAVFDWAGRW